MNDSTEKASSPLRTLALILLPLLGIALVVAAIYATRAKEKGTVSVVVAEGQPAAGAINTGEIIDATGRASGLAPQVGYRYKVFVDDESDDRSSGIAKIGGLVTFIPDARRGMTAIVDVTRVRDRVADASLVEVLSEVALPPKAPRGPFVPRPGDAAGHVVAGAEMDVVITEASEKNPETEGVAKVAGLVVFVNGATTIGERVNVRIVDRRERMAFAEPTGKPAGTDPLPTYAAPAGRRAFQPRPGDPVVVGAEMDVIITEASNQNPATEGIARVGGLVVVVNGATHIGERLNVRIVERRERMAFALPTGKPAGMAALASSGTTGDTLRRAFPPRANDPAGHVIAGAEMDVIVSEASGQNPDSEGVARVNGLVVFVAGATNLGERVNVRITARRERMAFAELTGKPAGTDPLPEPVAARPPRAPRPPYAPGPGDSAPYVVPGAVISTTIVEPSTRNPTTEGIAKIDGFVIFVKGATTPGQAVNVRITDRRPTVAMGEVTTEPVTVAPGPAVIPPPAAAAAPAAPVAAPAEPAPSEAPPAVPEPSPAEMPTAPEPAVAP